MDSHPLLSVFNSVLAVAPVGGGDVAITIQGITIERGNMTAIHGTTGRFDLTIVDNNIRDGSFNGGIGVRTGTSGLTRGLLFFDISRNKVTVPQGSSNQVNAIAVGAFKGSAYDGRIADNHIVMNRTVGTQGGAILVFSVDGTGTVDVVGNVVSGTFYNNGIYIRPDFGSVEARVINNQISGQTNVSGQSGAIAASSNLDGVVVTILNNTVVDNETGLSINGRADLGESLSGIVVNNVIARNSGVGLSIDSDFTGTVANHNNLLFANGSNFFVPGLGTVIEDPLFIGPDDFHLAARSPAIDAGDNNAPGLPTTDFDGDDRRIDDPKVPDTGNGTRPIVDIGADEFQPEGMFYLIPNKKGGAAVIYLE